MSYFMVLGLGSAFCLGPVSFELISAKLRNGKFPWRGLLGLLSADLIHLVLVSLLILLAPRQWNEWSALLNIPSIFILIFFGCKLILESRQQPRNYELSLDILKPSSFGPIFLSTLVNLHLVIFYFSIFYAQREHGFWQLSFSVASYFFSLIFGLGLLFGLTHVLRKSIIPQFHRISFCAGFGFLVLSTYMTTQLIRGIL